MSMVRRMRVVVLFASLLLGPGGSDRRAGSGGSKTTHVRTTVAHSRVPDSYSVASNDPSQIIFSDAISGGAFSVIATDGSAYNSLDDLTNQIATQAAASDGYQAGPNNGTSGVLAGNPASLTEYLSNNSSGTQVETAVFATLYQGKAYELVFVTTPASEDAFVAGAQGVFDSWQFT